MNLRSESYLSNDLHLEIMLIHYIILCILIRVHINSWQKEICNFLEEVLVEVYGPLDNAPSWHYVETSDTNLDDISTCQKGNGKKVCLCTCIVFSLSYEIYLLTMFFSFMWHDKIICIVYTTYHNYLLYKTIQK